MSDSEKRDKWERLKKEHPEFAKDLVELSKAFGKLDSVLVMGDNGQWLRVK